MTDRAGTGDVLAEAPFSDPGSMRIIVVVAIVLGLLWVGLVVAGLIAGYRSGAAPGRPGSLIVWIASALTQGGATIAAIAGGSVGSVAWTLVPFAATMASHPLGRTRRAAAADAPGSGGPLS